MLDADNSGEEAIKRAIESAEDLDFEIEVVTFDFAKDPDEAARADFEKFKKALKNKISIYDFLISRAQKLFPGDDAFAKKKIGDFVIPYIEKIRNPIVQEHYVKKLADILEISETSIWSLIRKIRSDKKTKGSVRAPKKAGEETREVSIQKYVLSILFQSKDAYKLADSLFTIIVPADFYIPAYQKIFEAFEAFRKEVPKEFDVKKFVLKLPAELRPVFDEIYLYASYEVEFENLNLEKLLNEIKKYSLKRQITEKLAGSNEKESQKKELKELSNKLNEVEKRLLLL